MKNAPTDFYAQLTISEYSDTGFTTISSETLYWEGDSTRYQELQSARVRWRRPDEMFYSSILFGEDGASYMDITQGAVGDCWWMASM